MQQLRVVDLAHTMGITPTELIFKLRSIGVNVSGEEDTLDLGTVRSIITGETLQRRPREVIVRSEPAQPETAGTTARERLARRRRRKVIKTEKEIREVVTEPAPAKQATDVADAVAETDVTEETPADQPEAAVQAAAEEQVVEEEAVEELPEEMEQAAEVAAEPVDADAEAGATVAAALDEPPADAAVPAVEETAQVEVSDEAPTEAVVTTGSEAAEEAVATQEESEQPVAAVSQDGDEEIELKPAPEVTEEELTSQRLKPAEEPQRVRPRRARTPLEQNLRELSPDEIKQRLVAQREAEHKRKQAAAAKPGGRKAKAAADAREIRDLLSKFEEQKLKGQQEGGAAAPRPARRPMAGRGGKKGRRRHSREERRPAPPRPTRVVQFRDGNRPEGPIILSEMVTTRELAEKLNVTAKDLLGLLIQKGVMVTTNQALPHELAEEICADLEVDAMVASAEEILEYEREEATEVSGPTEPRPPVVTVMGHVDHGKTSLLDSIRSSRVAEQEAGGITQHVGASRIKSPDGRTVVFVDTPGHEAFTQMRARGAQITDIVVLVVAADDGVMPQTEEAINHARAANVPLLIAINKIDKDNANPDRVKQQLADHELLIEEWGGDVPAVHVSAKTGEGIDDLLEMILLVAELKELCAVAEGPARGTVLEARKEKGRGIVATVIIQQGTLEVGDYFFCGSTWGRVRAIADDLGQRVERAGPSDPVEVMGFDRVPGAGDILQAVESEAKALEVASFRSQKDKEEGLVATRKVSLENLFDHIEASETKALNLVIKADVQGSVEVLKDTLTNLSTEKVEIHVLQGSVGAVTTNDVMLASASSAIIIGFNVRPERTARDLADTERVEVRLYTVIYELIDDVRNAMVGLLEPVFREEELGHAEVREVFRVPKIGSIAGSHVIDGIITRSSRVRLVRDHKVIYEGRLASLRRFKDDAADVRQGFDCGIGLDHYQDIKVGDVIEAYRMVEVAPEL